ncbi:MAG: phosphohistidine phosphatase SixA [Phycisphaerales bacterium]|nr:MAG: phosphohistidine phosphatase SixA [Phycisphaerales bacterium]
MRLYLVQHAQATSKDANPKRPLTEQGRRDAEKVAAFAKPLGLCVDYVWHSGKTRAAQTAEILAPVVQVTEETAGRDGLAPNDDVKAFRDDIEAAQRDVMLVGHLPFLSKLASLLLTGSESAEPVAFRQAGIVCLEYSDTSRWQLVWMVTPEILHEQSGERRV